MNQISLSQSFRNLFAIVLLAMVAVGCSESQSEADNRIEFTDTASFEAPFTISGQVFDGSHGNPLVGAVIVVNDARGIQIHSYDHIVSKEDGSFSIGNLREGTYRLRAFYSYNFDDARVDQEMLSDKIYVNEEGESIQVYFSEKAARKHFKSHRRMLIHRQGGMIGKLYNYLDIMDQILFQDPEDEVSKGFYVRERHQIRYWKNWLNTNV